MAQTHPIGTEIHYTGDMANQPGNGVVTSLRPATTYGIESMDITLEDGRVFRAVHLSNFSGIGRRFWTMTDYQADRAMKIAAMHAEYEAMLARKQ
jgi:hypothetical protein